MAKTIKLSKPEITQRLAKLSGWKHARNTLAKEFTLSSFTGAAKFIARIAPIANRMDHHPDLQLHRYKRVKIMLTTHDAGGITQKDFDLAAKIDALALVRNRAGMSARRLVVIKHAKSLTVFDGVEEVLRIPVVIGKNPADKQREGDLATPEGEFYICYKNPESKYHRFLGLSYPNLEDAERGLRERLIAPNEYQEIRDAMVGKKCPPWKSALGGEVGLHGPCPNITWTHGCVAMDVEQIERLYELLDIGDEVTILP